MEKVIVVVTGGTGYIASWVVRDLLKEGHEVRTTVRNMKDEEKYLHLLNLEKKYDGTLKIYEADLVKSGSFDQAIEGADYVIHTASPFSVDRSLDPKKDLLEPAVKGTVNVLEGVNRSKSVKRVVLTSSLAAIYGDNRDMRDFGIDAFDETMWNTTSSLKNNPYSYSKTMAEKKAWEMAEQQNEWDLITIHPGFVFGPSLSKRVDATSVDTLRRLLGGEFRTGVPHLEYVFSDIRDIATGHIRAAFTEEAKGRYIIANENGSFIKMAKIIKHYYGKRYKMPVGKVPKFIVWVIAPMMGLSRQYIKNNVGYKLKADNSRSIIELKMSYRSLETTLIDHIEQLRKDDLI
ncbi:NAD-dependent epimerase/dehydratase family protein [Petrocella sp. FN5]|uniref:NAD-dependent epimerase/dehydratase family protein n=1 Tax=Petrocella sp. FN5 TaxID=3032002 RepID=UPI0023DCC97F|nr:NAD-dependent epimerase/dehydratase family protein [Petrocella sp. FN5]MDF1618484.1 NAD-dependent epimerase/dehydratase family protein [Petrocella sp. FN5]